MRSSFLLTAALLSAAFPLAAQDSTAAGRESNVTILDITVDPAANERHVVFLQKGVVYRARFGGPGITIRMRSLGNRLLPFVVNVTALADATGATELELYPASDGDVELTPIGNQDQVPVRFQLWRDARATARGQQAAEQGAWSVGIDAVYGWHPDYEAHEVLAAKAGTTFGACLSARNGPGLLGRLNGCAVGIEWLTGETGEGLTSIFTAPRIRIFGPGKGREGWVWEAGLAGHLAIISDGNDGGNFTQGPMGLGWYVARDLTVNADGDGWRITLVGRFDSFDHSRTETAPDFKVIHTTRWLPAVQLGVGRYF